MLRIVVVISLLLMTACSNGTAEDLATRPTSTVAAPVTTQPQVTSSTASPVTEVTSPPTTSVVGVGSELAACVVGEWELDTTLFEPRMEAFYEVSGMDAEVSIAGGRVLLDVGSEGRYVGGYDELTVDVTADPGLPRFTVSFGGVVSGAYVLDGDQFVLTPDDQSTLSATVDVAGVSITPSGELGLDDVDLFSQSVSTLTCDGAGMTIQPEAGMGPVSDWVRR
ncbi:hypothetical protein BH23ACT5_BH23ACT5_00460 [soil metagenome]